jgi:protease I
MQELTGARVLMLATNGFEEDELFLPRQALLDAGAEVTLAAISTDPITGEKAGEKGRTITPDVAIAALDTAGFHALVLPGGVANPDTLRTERRAVEIVGEFMGEGRIVAAICHAPWLLVEADVIDGRRVTGWPSIRTDLANAGASVLDEAVVVDGTLITSRKPDDIPAFNRALIDCLRHALGKRPSC